MKSPAELVFGTVTLTDRFTIPEMDMSTLANQTLFMGQHLLNPPSVEGWHEGEGGVGSGGVSERINFASGEVTRGDASGVRRMIERVAGTGAELQPEEFVDACLDAMGSIDLSDRTKSIVISHAAAKDTPFRPGSAGSEDRTLEMFQLIVSTPDFQYC